MNPKHGKVLSQTQSDALELSTRKFQVEILYGETPSQRIHVVRIIPRELLIRKALGILRQTSALAALAAKVARKRQKTFKLLLH